MATTAQIASIQQLYVAYFNRPADAAGLDFWATQVTNGAPLSTISATFAATPEYKTLYANLSNDQVVSTIYQNLFNRAPDASGLKFWSDKLSDKSLTVDNVVAAVAASAQQDPAAGPDTVAIQSKVAAAVAFTDYLNTDVDSRIAYSSGSVNSVGVNYIHNVIDAATLATAKTSLPTTVDADLQNGGVVTGSTSVLTGGVDAITGTAGNDIINSLITNDGASLTTLDTITGGNGTDTLNIVDNRTGGSAAAIVQADISPAGATITGVEVMSITSNSAIGATGAGAIDTTGIAGLTNVNLVSGAGVFVTADAATAVKVTSASGNVEVNGGKSAEVKSVGTIAIAGDSLVSATVTGGTGSISVSDSAGETLKSVTLKSIGADATVTSDSVSDITVSGANAAARTVTVVNTTTGHTLNVTAAGAGLTAAGAVATVTVDDAAATTIALTSTAKSNISLVSAAATKVTAAGAGDLALNLDGGTNTLVTSFDGSAATGKLTLTGVAAATVAVSTGAGNDSFTTTQITKSAFNTGAGNDTITIGSIIAAGSTINLGAGNDVLLASAGSIAASGTTAATTTVIDGGEGVDSVSALLINIGNAGQFTNFEAIDLSGTGSAYGVDVALLPAATNAISSLTLNGGTGGVTVSNVAATASLTVAGAASGVTTINATGVTGTADAFNIAFNGAAAATAPVTANVTAGTIAVEGFETVNIASTGAANTWNSIALTDAKLKAVAITGADNLNLTFVGTNGTNVSASAGGGVAMIDGSAATGKLNINTTNVVADTASAGLTIKGGTAADTITLGAHAATVDGGAGADTIVTSAGFSSTLTGGAGNDTFNVAATVAGAAGNTGYKFTTVTDLNVGDVLKFAATQVTFNATKVDVSAASDFNSALTLAVDAGAAGTTVDYFVYGGNTYVVDVAAANATHALAAGDVVVKLSGVVDLSHATLSAGALTIA